jgi:hypothetical protein
MTKTPIRVGSTVRITSMARTDVVGRVIEIQGDRYHVKVPNFHADGWPKVLVVYRDELEKAPRTDRRGTYEVRNTWAVGK